MYFYKKFIQLFFLTPLIIVSIIVLYVLFFYAKPQTLLLMKLYYEQKELYAKSIHTNKIVITSGSNALYGLNTIDIEKALHVPVVNFAVNAGLNNNYIFTKTQEILRPGDIVIVPDEYQHIIWDGELSKSKNQYILAYDRKYFNALPFLEQLKIINTISLKDIYDSIIEQSRFTKESINKGKRKTLKSLNKNGDKIDKNGYFPKKIAHTNSPFPLKSKFHFPTKGLKEIVKFNTWCQEHHIYLYMTFPNTVKLKEYNEKKYINFFQQLTKFYKDNHIQFLGYPTDFFYPEKYFHDTNYHLNTVGAK